jgi:hypothetical protein
MNDEQQARSLPRAPSEAELRAALTVPVETAGRALGLSRMSAYRAVHAGQIPSLKIGSRLVVPTAPLLALLGRN